jgi:HEPN/Toprim N-terminal domain 1
MSDAMTSACELKFDDMSIAEQKAYVPDEFIYLFQESDRRVIRRAGEDNGAVTFTQAFHLARGLLHVTIEVCHSRPLMEDAELAKLVQSAPTYIGLERVIRYCLIRFAEQHKFIGIPPSQACGG